MSVLEVAADHRLRDIIRELMELNEAPLGLNPSSNHCENLRQLAKFMHGWGRLISKDGGRLRLLSRGASSPGRYCSSIDTAATGLKVQYPN
jgi:hypothetical protein